jgi:RNA binding exosome subunit
VLERVQTAVLNLYPSNLRENIEIEVDRATSYSKTPIVIVTASTQKKTIAEKTFHHIINHLTIEDKEELARTLSQRINEKCVLFVRIDKQAAFLGEIRLSKSPDLVHVEIRFIMYPRCDKETVIAHIMDQIHTEEA